MPEPVMATAPTADAATTEHREVDLLQADVTTNEAAIAALQAAVTALETAVDDHEDRIVVLEGG